MFDEVVVLGLSCLVSCKGFDKLIEVAVIVGCWWLGLWVVIFGGGRDREWLEWLVGCFGVDVCFFGWVFDEDKVALFGCVDVFGMLCCNWWGGLE